VEACDALGKIGEKAATNEVITQLVLLANKDNDRAQFNAVGAIENILSSSAGVKQLTPKVVADLCVCRYKSDYFKHVSEEELINIYQTTKNPDCLSAVTELTLLRGTAVTANENGVVLYGKTKLAELRILNSEMRQQLFEAFTTERKRLHLFAEISVEADRNEP
jgi:hypothetical protein